MANAGNSVVGSERLITKIYFPRLAVPLATVGAAVVDFLIASGLLVVLMIWRGVAPGWGLVLAPAIFLLLAVAAAGVGTLLSALTVAYRDFRFVVPFLAQFWMFCTVAIYKKDWSSMNRLLVEVNPMNGLIGAFRASILDQPIPWTSLGISATAAAILFVAGCYYFRRVEDTFADIV
jgi:lipopolysaccharide transport system permease protein